MTIQKTVLRYAGGKSRAIKKITPFVEPYDTIVSPFIGGGSLEVHWASKGKKVIGSDIFGLLINFWDVLLESPDALAKELKKIEPTASAYKIIKEMLMCTSEVQEMLSHRKSDFYKREQVSIPAVKLAAYYYFNHNCSYGPGFLGWPSKIYMNQEKWNKTIEKIRTFSCPNLQVAHREFETAIKESGSAFLYLDPPYYLQPDDDNKMLGGIYPMKNIPVHHNNFDHEKLRDLLLSHKGDFVLSYNNCETIREWYSDFELFFPEWHYSMDVGEVRIGSNRMQRVGDEQTEAANTLRKEIESVEEKLKKMKTKELKVELAALKTAKHDIMKKESHELLIVKRKKGCDQ